jgi:hypothetical protein
MSATVGVPRSVIAEIVSARRIVERPRHAGLARRRERPEDRPPDEDARAPSAQRGHDVEPAPDPAVDPDLAPPRPRRRSPRARRPARPPIELARAVVRDDDPVDAVLDRERASSRSGSLEDDGSATSPDRRESAQVRPWSIAAPMMS